MWDFSPGQHAYQSSARWTKADFINSTVSLTPTPHAVWFSSSILLARGSSFSQPAGSTTGYLYYHQILPSSTSVAKTDVSNPVLRFFVLYGCSFPVPVLSRGEASAVQHGESNRLLFFPESVGDSSLRVLLSIADEGAQLKMPY